MSQGLIFSPSPLSHLIKPINNSNEQLLCRTIEKHFYGSYINWRYAHVLDCIALEEAVWVLKLQRLLILYGAKPPGIVNDAAETHSLKTIKHYSSAHNIGKQAINFFSGPTWLPIVLFSLVVKLLEHQKVNDIRHVMVPLERERAWGSFVLVYYHLCPVP